MFLDNFLNVYKIVAAIGFVICLFGFVYHARKRDDFKNQFFRINIKAIIFGFSGILLVASIFKISDFTESEMHAELKDRLDESVFQTIHFNNNQIDSVDIDTILYSLRKLHFIQPHHSHTIGDSYDLKIISSFDTLTLRLKSDSEIENEYWVFCDKYKSTSRNEIGRIRNDVFNKYK